MQVILANVGSLGDIHPYLAIGRALRARGHRVVMISNRESAEKVQACGLDFESAGDNLNGEAAAASALLWHRIKGLGVLWRHLLAPAILPTYDAIVRLAGAAPSVVVAAPLMFGARLAQERLGVRLLSAYTAPSLLRTCRAPLTIAHWRLPAGTPSFAAAAFWRVIDRYKLEPMARPALAAARARIGLPAGDAGSLFGSWMHSPLGGITLFPEWFAPARPDWPKQLRFGGFPLYDEADAALAPELLAFLAAGAAPIVFMPGSEMRHARGFFAAALAACTALGRRAVFLTRYPEQVPAGLPAEVLHRPYAPFGALLSRSAMLVHHGGIGSASQAMRAGIPQIVMPMSHDQFDNAWRIESLGLGRALPAHRFDADRLARTMRSLFSDGREAQRQAVAVRVRDDPALARLCDAIEAHG
ncbi:MAG: glycosyltransferase [Caldimonas sp.]